MDLRLTDRVAFIAGSSRGIGRAIARAFLGEGARVGIAGRQADSLAETTASLEARFGTERILACNSDLTKTDEIATAMGRTLERWNAIEIGRAHV